LQAAGLKMPIDNRVKQHIRELVAEGIFNAAEVKRHTEIFVKNCASISPKTSLTTMNRRYHPTRRDIINFIYRCRVAQMHSRIDQENLLLKLSSWQTTRPSDSFLFRPYTDNSTLSIIDSDEVTCSSGGRSGLLLVHQTEWQKRLLNRYGTMCLLDATYKTTRYAVPLFFLCVRSNVDYVVVASFVTQYEDSASIAEALNIIKSWNSTWIPDSFMVDFCEPEILALESVFPGKLTRTQHTHPYTTLFEGKIAQKLRDFYESITDRCYPYCAKCRLNCLSVFTYFDS